MRGKKTGSNTIAALDPGAVGPPQNPCPLIRVKPAVWRNALRVKRRLFLV